MQRKTKRKAKTLFDHKGQVKQSNIEQQMSPLHSCYCCKHLDRKKKVHHCGNFYGYRCKINKTHAAGIRKDMFGTPREEWILKHCSCGAFEKAELEACTSCANCVYLNMHIHDSYNCDGKTHKRYACEKREHCVGYVEKDKELKYMGCGDGRKK